MTEIRPKARLAWDEYGGVRVMAVADGYAMVRRPGCMPFVVWVKELASRQPGHHDDERHPDEAPAE